MHILLLVSLSLMPQLAGRLLLFIICLKGDSSNNLFVAHPATGGSFLFVQKGTKATWGLPPLNPVGGHRNGRLVQ
jgi:hypothetical protein